MKPRTPQAGFTIIETLVGAAIASVLALAGWSFFRGETRALGDHSALLDATDRVRGSMAFMAREIRQTGYDPLLTGLNAVTEARPDRLTIQYDSNRSGTLEADAVDPNAEVVEYRYDAANGRVLRTVAGSSQPLVKGLATNGLVFEYFDSQDNQLAPSGNPAQLTAAQRNLIALVRVNLRVRASGMVSPTTLTLTSRITVPNRILERL